MMIFANLNDDIISYCNHGMVPLILRILEEILFISYRLSATESHGINDATLSINQIFGTNILQLCY